MKISVCNELFEGWPIEKVFEYAAGLGYDGVEIAPYTLADSVRKISPKRRRAIRQAAETWGVEIVGLHWLLVKPKGLSINHPDEAIRTRTREYIKALIDLCADLGGRLLLHGSPRQRTVQEGWDSALAREYAKETFRGCMELAQERKVFYCIEPLTRTNTNFINTVKEGVRFAREVGHPHFKLMFDCRSASENEPSVTDALASALKSRMLCHVHVNDANGRGPGFGQTRFLPILRTLKENHYRGYISVEVFHFDPDPRTIASRSIGYLRGILETLDEKE